LTIEAQVPARRLEPGVLQAFERRLDDALATLPSPGLNAAILVDNEVAWTYATGVARFEPSAALTPRHLHRIGSITKLFTAHAVMVLREQGLLDIDVPLHTYIPEFRPEGGEQVTIRHVLCHGSGMETNAGLDVWRLGVFPEDAEFRSLIGSTRLVAAPMVTAKYSNSAISMLGLVIAGTAGTRYEQFVTDAILQPLGMTDTHFDLPPDAADRFAPGHSLPPYEERYLQAPHQDLQSWNACGMLLSTPADTLRLAVAQWNGAAPWSPATRDEMHRLQLLDHDAPGWSLGYGLGWRLHRVGERIFAGHGGGYVGNRCQMELSLTDRVAVALYANCNRAEGVIPLAHEMLGTTIDALPPARPGRFDDRPVPDHLAPLLGRFAVRHWGEVTIEYADGGVRFAGNGAAPIRIGQDAAGSLIIMAGRAAGEEVAVLKRDPAGRAVRLSVAGMVYERV
jgi:D-alanyl-D-alanine carboxypeptidase